MKIPVLIGLVGRARSGKGTISDYLIERYAFTRYGFADPLKQMLINAGMCTYQECYVKKTEHSRWLMQKIGTDIFRKQIDPLFWVKQGQQQISNLLLEGYNVVVDDVRNPDESIALKALGGIVIKVERINEDGTPYYDPDTDSNHESERLVDSIIVDYKMVARSGDVEALRKGIDDLIKLIQKNQRL